MLWNSEEGSVAGVGKARGMGRSLDRSDATFSLHTIQIRDNEAHMDIKGQEGRED